jgi:hypothetical protein
VKTRLLPSLYTDEDCDVWSRVDYAAAVSKGGQTLHVLSLYQDRCDADLMLYLGTNYADIIGWQRGYPGVWHSACAFQGIAMPRELASA